MYEKIESILEDFTLTKSGLFFGLLRRLRMSDSSQGGYVRRSIAIAAITWLPLFILSALQGLAFGNRVETPFWMDFGTHLKLLVVIPMLVIAEKSVDVRLKELTTQFFKSGILNEADLSELEKIKKTILRLSKSVIVTLSILLIVTVILFVRWRNIETSIHSIWFMRPDVSTPSLSWGGIYFAFISLPLLQFIVFQWLWYWVVWLIYFFKLSKLPLRLNPAHPDLAGGIGFLGFPPGPFIQVTTGVAILYTAAISTQIYLNHHKLPDYYIAIGGFAVVSVIINVTPLLVFIKPLLFQRRKGYFEYSALVQEHHRQFDTKWIGKPVAEEIIGFGDASSLTDFNTSFDTVKKNAG